MVIFDFLRDEGNARALTILGAVVAALVAALWVAFIYFDSKQETSPSVIVQPAPAPNITIIVECEERLAKIEKSIALEPATEERKRQLIELTLELDTDIEKLPSSQHKEELQIRIAKVMRDLNIDQLARFPILEHPNTIDSSSAQLVVNPSITASCDSMTFSVPSHPCSTYFPDNSSREDYSNLDNPLHPARYRSPMEMASSSEVQSLYRQWLGTGVSYISRSGKWSEDLSKSTANSLQGLADQEYLDCDMQFTGTSKFVGFSQNSKWMTFPIPDVSFPARNERGGIWPSPDKVTAERQELFESYCPIFLCLTRCFIELDLLEP